MGEEEFLDLLEKRTARCIGCIKGGQPDPECCEVFREYHEVREKLLNMLGCHLLLEMVRARREVVALANEETTRLRVHSLPELDFDADELGVIWRRYANEEPDKLTPAARMLGERLRSVFEEVEARTSRVA
jgi:hypothetical protein